VRKERSTLIHIKWYQSRFLVCIFQARGVRKERSTLIHIKWYQSEKISFSVAEKKGKFHHAAEERKTITRSRG
jgi:hypothetical protein